MPEIVVNTTPISISSIVLALKACLGCFAFVWVRATLCRFKFDQLMNFCWTQLLPMAIAFLLFVPSVMVAFNIIVPCEIWYLYKFKAVFSNYMFYLVNQFCTLFINLVNQFCIYIVNLVDQFCTYIMNLVNQFCIFIVILVELFCTYLTIFMSLVKNFRTYIICLVSDFSYYIVRPYSWHSF